MSAGSTSERSSALHFREYLHILHRRIRLVVVCFAVVVGAAVYFTYIQPEIYYSSTTLYFGSGFSKAILPEKTSVIESYLLDKLSFETQLDLVRREPVLDRIIRVLELADPQTDRAAYAAWISRLKGIISVSRIGDTRHFSINARAPNDAAFAQRLANTAADALIQIHEERKNEALNESIVWLNEELTVLRKRVKSTENDLIDYLNTDKGSSGANAILSSSAPGGTAGSAVVRALEEQLTGVELRRAELLRRYKSKHPKVVAVDQEVREVARRLRKERSASIAHNRKLIEFNMLRNEADLNKELFNLLTKKLKEADIAARLSGNTILVVERAKMSTKPISPNRPRNITIAIFLGLFFSVGAAFAMDYLNPSIETEGDIERILGLPVLAAVSRFKDRPGETAFRLTQRDPSSKESEMFRTLRTNIKFSSVGGERHTLLVTSGGPAEGKSTVVCNLAETFAGTGKRTLIVDTDLRKPHLHKVFGMSDSRGLVDVLVGEARLDQVIHPTDVPKLHVIPRGSWAPNPAELLDSARMREIIGLLRQHFDEVVFDSPPVGSVVDASILAAQVDGVLLVVEAGRLGVPIMRRVRRQLETVRAKVYGVLLNKVSRSPTGYYYHYYYYADQASKRGARKRKGGAPTKRA